MHPQDSLHLPANTHVTREMSPPPTNDQGPTISTRRSEVLRHVFPRPSPSDASTTREHPPRSTKPVTKIEYRRRLSSFRQSRPRVAFHRVITSIFNHNPTRDEAHSGSPRLGSNESGTRSRVGSMFGSIPSLDVISPATFLFSGPSLRSTYSGSFSTPNSRRPSVADTISEPHTPLRRTQSESFDSLGDSILEPFFERGITQSLSDVLLGMSTPFDEMDKPIIEDLNEDDHVLPNEDSQQVHSQMYHLDPSVIALVSPYLDFVSWKALRLACRPWHSSLNSIAPPKFSSAYHLPLEIVQEIYNYLAPRDYNSARRTCRAWMWASLDKKLLVAMLRRGGWWTSAENELKTRHRTANFELRISTVSDEWFLSQKISKECSLSAGWTGNGLDSLAKCSPLVDVSQTNFTDLANGYSSPVDQNGGSLVFSTSTCGRLMLVARETLIFVYELQSATLQPLTTVTCPRRVIAMSMDVTSGRYAVAALLEGRMGMVCELQFGRNTGADTGMEIHVETHTHVCRTTTRTSILTSQESEFEGSGDFTQGTCSSVQDSGQSGTPQHSWTNFSSVDVQANYNAISLQGTDDQRTFEENLINHTWNLHLRGAPAQPRRATKSACDGNIPMETGTSTFYRHLCSEDDPPRSVSICPQRRCVAFGCSAGIELHWIDALTGQSLSRWFPLTAPSDYLYFLPPRPGIESAKKLRLISSAAHPSDRPALSRKFSLSRPTISSWWGSFGFDSHGNRPGSSSCDHYRALPLSDGHHVLFIDPPSGKLFLGCDAPLGGPTKLLRKIMLVPPQNSQLPRVYAAAADLTWGARVVVAFDDTIMLYSVPPDVFAQSRQDQRVDNWDVYNAPPFSTIEGRTKDHWLNWWQDDYAPGQRNPIWPLAIRGVEVGTLQGVCELAIYTHPDLTIWAFALNSQARTWQMRKQAKPGTCSRRYVCRSGIVHHSHSVDETGDVIMSDFEHMHVSPSKSLHLDADAAKQPARFDGHSSRVWRRRIPKALSVENNERVDAFDVRACDPCYNTSGDVFLADGSEAPLGWEVEVVEE